MLGRLALWLLLALALAAPALADTRVALVIANADYKAVAKLPNPPNDARNMAAALRKVGFVTTEKTNLTKRDLEAALKAFAASAREADVAVIYYAGHGMEQGGLNYLVPIDATLASDQDVEFDTVPLDLLLRSVEGASRMKLVILDACRNNPFLTSMRRSGGTRAVSRGLARVEPDSDILVAYAAREGATADDGDGTDSPFTRSLTQRLLTPGVEIRLLFGQVRDDVRKSTGGRQEPAIYGSLGGDPFYFVPPASSQAVAVAAPATVAAPAMAARSTPAAADGDKPYAQALAHLEASEWQAAIEGFDTIVRNRPRNAGAWHNRGRAKFGAGDVDGAIADATRAIALMPRNEGSYVARARYYRQKLMWDQALADNDMAVSLAPDAEVYFQRGLTYEGKGDAAAAAADYAKALEINPRFARAAQARARMAKRR